MKRLALLLPFLLIPTHVFASEANVSIKNSVNSNSTNSNSQVTSHTDITVETNGEVTHYSSDEPNKSIKVESKNGVSKIEVDGQEVSGNNNVSPTPSNSMTPTPIPNNEKTDSEDKDLDEGFVRTLLENLLKPFEAILSIFR